MTGAWGLPMQAELGGVQVTIKGAELNRAFLEHAMKV